MRYYEELKKETKVLFFIQKGKLKYLGHIMRCTKYETLCLILGKIEGKELIGTWQISWHKKFWEGFGIPQ